MLCCAVLVGVVLCSGREERGIVLYEPFEYKIDRSFELNQQRQLVATCVVTSSSSIVSRHSLPISVATTLMFLTVA